MRVKLKFLAQAFLLCEEVFYYDNDPDLSRRSRQFQRLVLLMCINTAPRKAMVILDGTLSSRKGFSMSHFVIQFQKDVLDENGQYKKMPEQP